MIYLNTNTCMDTGIDVATASLDQLLEAYNSLLDLSDDGGAYPSSLEARKAKVYAGQLRALVAARPEIEDWRKQLQASACRAKLVTTYID